MTDKSRSIRGTLYAYNSRGMAYAAKLQFDRAIEDYDRQIEIDARHPDAYNNRANAYLGKGEPDRAIQDYDAQIAINPRHRHAYANRGRAYLA